MVLLVVVKLLSLRTWWFMLGGIFWSRIFIIFSRGFEVVHGPVFLSTSFFQVGHFVVLFVGNHIISR